MFTLLHQNKNSLSYHVLFVSFLLSFIYVAHVAEALGTFGYDIHHRYSDTVKKILGGDGLPEKDTLEYFTVLVHRDHLRGRHLASGDQLTFVSGNLTARISELGFLQYVYVKVGTPGRDFLVALDSGSDLFWVPCECTDCPRSITLRSGKSLDFNIYALNGTSTVTPVTCTSPICGPSYGCFDKQFCSYQTKYIPFNTSSSGILLQDVLQLATNENPSTPLNTNVTLGCGILQTGAFLSSTAVNGLLGLGVGSISVPSILASKGLTADSFSLCSGPDSLGRIVFGDKGSLDQSETPFSISQTNYIVSIEQVSIGSKASVLEFSAVFDSGLAFTTLSDPVYTTLAESFDAQVLEPPRFIADFPFKYCYDLSSTASGPATPKSPDLAFTMSGGSQFNILSPIILVNLQNSGYAYCLGVIKSQSNNIIGLNFMTGQKLTFDREKNVLGWKLSNCNGNDDSNTTPPSPSTSNPPPPPRASTPPPPPRTPSTTPPPPDTTSGSTEAPPPPPESPANNTTNSPPQIPGVRLPGTGDAAQLNSFTWKFGMAFLSILIHYFIFH